MSIHKLRTELGHYFKWVLLGVLVPIFVIGGIFAFGPGGLNGGNNRQSGADSEVIATVNGIDLTRGEFEGVWDRTQQQLGQGGVVSPIMLAQYRAMVFQQLVQSKQMIAAAKEADVDVSDSAVNAEIDKAVTQFLKQDRKSILGELTKQEEAVDPRNDSNYKLELSKLDPPSSVSDRENAAKAMIPRDQVVAQLAQQGLVKKIQAGIKPVTDADVKDSYNVTKLTQIAVTGGSKEQLRAKAEKIVAEAKKGTDFQVLAKTNNANGPFAKTGSQVVYSFDTRNSVIPAVRDAASKMKVGDVSEPVDLGGAYIVFKLDQVVPKLPAKMDKKTLDARKKEIEQDRQQAAMMTFQQEMSKKLVVDAKDPEMKGYWLISQSMTSPAKAPAMRKAAEAAFKQAIKDRENNIYASAQLASMYVEDQNFKDAEILLNSILNVQHRESAEMRKMFGDVLVKVGKKDDAIKNYQIAGDMSRNNNPTVMDQLVQAYKAMGRSDLASQMVAQKADYEKRRAAFEAMQKKAAAPAPKPAGKK